MEVSVTQKQQRVDPGDTSSIELTIRQKGILPLLMGKISLEMDDAIELSGGKMHRRRERTLIESHSAYCFGKRKQ